MTAAIPALIPLGQHAGKAPIPLGRPVMLIGSRSNARIHLISSTVSKAHALLVVGQHTVYIHDLASREHVYVNGQRVLDVDLDDGDLIKIGSFSFRFDANGKELAPEKTPQAPPAFLNVTGAPVPVPIEQRVVLIGKRPTCDIPLLEDSVSTAHAVIFELDGRRFVRDLGSRTGTFVNEVSTHQHELRPGDVIRVGETDLIYRLADQQQEDRKDQAVTSLVVPPTQATSPSGSEQRPLSVEADELLSILNAENSSSTDDQPSPTSSVAQTASASESEIELPSTENADVEQPLSVRTPTPEETSSSPQPPADTAPVVSQPIAEGAAQDQPVRPLEPFELIEPPGSEEPTDTVPVDQEPAWVDLDSRGGWRSPWAPERESQAPTLVESGSDPTDTAQADVTAPEPSQAAKEDVLRFDEDNLRDKDDAGSVAVVDQDTLQSEADDSTRARPFDEAEFEQDVASPTIDLAAALDTTETSKPEVPSDQPTEISLTDLDQTLGSSDQTVEPQPDELELQKRLLDLEDQSEESAGVLNLQPPVFDQTPAIDQALKEDLDALEARVQAEPEPPSSSVAPDQVEPPQPETSEQAPAGGPQRSRKPKSRKGRSKTEPTAPDKPRRSRKRSSVPVVPVVQEAQESVEPPPTPQASSADIPPAAQDQAAEVEGVEVVSATQPTPESALPAVAEEPAVVESSTEPQLGEMTDTMLGRAVEELSGDYPGDLVEEPPAPTQTVSESSAPTQPEPSILPEEAQPPSVLPSTKEPIAVSEKQEDGVTADDLIAALAASDSVSTLPEDHEQDQPPVATPDLVAPQAASTVADQDQESSIPPVEPDTATQRKQDDPATPTPLWGNQENVLGGMPLHLPEPPPAPFGTVPISEAIGPERPFAVPIPSVGLAASRRRARQEPGSQDSAQPASPLKSPEDASIPDYDPAIHVDSQIHGLADPPVREADVFAQSSPAAGSEEAGELDEDAGVSLEENRALSGTGAWEPQASAPGALTTVQSPSRRRSPMMTATAPVVILSSEQEQVQLGRRRQRLRRIPVLLGVMLVLIVLVCLLIWQFGPVRHVMEASIRFNVPESLTQRERDSFQEARLSALSSPTVVSDARNRLRLWDASVPAGFLETPQSLNRLLQDARWERGRLLIRTEASNETHERLRLQALLAAAWEAHQPLLQQMREARSAQVALEQQLLRDKARLDALNEQVRRLTALADAAPSESRIAELVAAVEQAEQAWEARRLVVREHRDALRTLRESPSSEVGPLDAQDAPAEKEDARLAEMTRALQDLQRQLDASRRLNERRAQEARQALDESVEQFQRELAAAQGIAQGNPELEKYLAAAQELQKTTRELIDELIRRQEQMSGRLSELRARLSERMEARRTELWKGDKQLQDLTEQLAITTRLYNAAVGSGQQSEAEDLAAQVDLLKSLIKARQELLPGDPFFAEAILHISELIDTTQKNIEQDRHRIEEKLRQLQQAFTASAPAVEKLPQEQRELTQAMEKRLADINQARRRYAQALDQADAQSDAQLQQQVQALQAGIELRRRQLAEENRRHLTRQQQLQRQAEIERLQSELETAEQAESEAREVFFARDRELREARQSAERARATREQLVGLQLQQRELSASHELLLKQVELKTRQAMQAVEPLAPIDSDVARVGGVDRRPMYAGLAGGSILVVFIAWILWTLHNAANDLTPVQPRVASGGDSSITPADSDEQDTDDDESDSPSSDQTPRTASVS